MELLSPQPRTAFPNYSLADLSPTAGAGLPNKVLDSSVDRSSEIYLHVGQQTPVPLGADFPLEEMHKVLHEVRKGSPVSPAEFLKKRTPPQIEQPPVTPKHEPSRSVTAGEFAGVPVKPKATSKPVSVCFEFLDGAQVESAYTEVLVSSSTLILCFDRENPPGFLYRPGVCLSDANVAVEVEFPLPDGSTHKAAYRCYVPGISFTHRQIEYIVLIVEETAAA